MGTRQVDFETGINRLSSYARKFGHANPKTTEIWLTWRIGLWVGNLRKKFREGKLSSEQIAIARNLGVNFEPPYRPRKSDKLPGSVIRVRRLLGRLSQLESFFAEHGHINVAQHSAIDGWIGAGRWIARLRMMYRSDTLPGQVQKRAEQLNINWNPGAGTRTDSTTKKR